MQDTIAGDCVRRRWEGSSVVNKDPPACLLFPVPVRSGWDGDGLPRTPEYTTLPLEVEDAAGVFPETKGTAFFPERSSVGGFGPLRPPPLRLSLSSSTQKSYEE